MTDTERVVKIDVDYISYDKMAYLFSDGSKEFWFPKASIIDFEKEDNKFISITIPEWLAIEKGLV